MFEGNDHPSDIDMFYVCRDNTLIIGEIKSVYGSFAYGQRRMIGNLLKSHKGDGVGLYITHDKLVQNGDKVVDVSKCQVAEIYIKAEGRWRKPKKPVDVKTLLNYYKKRAEWKMEREY